MKKTSMIQTLLLSSLFLGFAVTAQAAQPEPLVLNSCVLDHAKYGTMLHPAAAVYDHLEKGHHKNPSMEEAKVTPFASPKHGRLESRKLENKRLVMGAPFVFIPDPDFSGNHEMSFIVESNKLDEWTAVVNMTLVLDGTEEDCPPSSILNANTTGSNK